MVRRYATYIETDEPTNRIGLWFKAKWYKLLWWIRGRHIIVGLTGHYTSNPKKKFRHEELVPLASFRMVGNTLENIEDLDLSIEFPESVIVERMYIR